MERREEIEKMRSIMGTQPKEFAKNKTEFFDGVEGIKVKMIDYPANPYKAIYTLACSTWGDHLDKWKETPTHGRLEVVKAALEGNVLPACLEAPKFAFTIENLSRAAFDQIARARYGVAYGAAGVRDNNWLDCGYRIPNAIARNVKMKSKVKKTVLNCKNTYSYIVGKGKQSWQAARCVLPMNIAYRFSMTIDYFSLKGMCANRMKFCEMEDTVGVAWLLREALKERFPLLAAYLRPGCDFTKKCQYHKAYALSEYFGCLFAPCGRNKDENEYKYSTFNESCSDSKLIAKQLGITIPKPTDWEKITADAIKKDIDYFGRD